MGRKRREGKVAGFGALAAPVLAVGMAPKADAAFIATVDQVGPDVVVTGRASFDTAGLTFISPNVANSTAFVIPSDAVILGGGGTQNAFSGRTPDDPSFRGGGLTNASGTSGAVLGIAFAAPVVSNSLYFPNGYVSDTSVSDRTTFSGATFANLGVTPGTFVWTWGSGADADSFTLQIGPAQTQTVPEPASLTLLAIGLACLSVALRMRRA